MDYASIFLIPRVLQTLGNKLNRPVLRFGIRGEPIEPSWVLESLLSNR